MTIGETIRDLRKKAGLTQKALAEKASIATITLQQYELGKREPRVRQLQLIANALGCPVERLINTGQKESAACGAGTHTDGQIDSMKYDTSIIEAKKGFVK